MYMSSKRREKNLMMDEKDYSCLFWGITKAKIGANYKDPLDETPLPHSSTFRCHFSPPSLHVFSFSLRSTSPVPRDSAWIFLPGLAEDNAMRWPLALPEQRQSHRVPVRDGIPRASFLPALLTALMRQTLLNATYSSCKPQGTPSATQTAVRQITIPPVYSETKMDLFPSNTLC